MDWDIEEKTLLFELQYSGFSQFRIDQIMSLKGQYRGDSYEKYWHDKLIEIRKAAVTEYDKSRKRYLGKFDFSGIPNSWIINRALSYMVKRLLIGVDRNKGLNAASWRTGMLYFEWAKLAIGKGFVCKPSEAESLISIAALTLHDLTEQLDDDEHSRAMNIGVTELCRHLAEKRIELEEINSVKDAFRIVKEFLNDFFQSKSKLKYNLLNHPKYGPQAPLEIKEEFQRLDDTAQIMGLELDQLKDTFEDWEGLPQNRLESIAEAIRTLQETHGRDIVFKHKYQWIGIYEVMCEHHLLPDNEKSTFCRICNSPDDPNYFLPEDEYELPNAYIPGKSGEKGSTWDHLVAHGKEPRQRKNIDSTKREFELLLEEYGVI